MNDFADSIKLIGAHMLLFVYSYIVVLKYMNMIVNGQRIVNIIA